MAKESKALSIIFSSAREKSCLKEVLGDEQVTCN